MNCRSKSVCEFVEVIAATLLAVLFGFQPKQQIENNSDRRRLRNLKQCRRLANLNFRKDLQSTRQCNNTKSIVLKIDIFSNAV